MKRIILLFIAIIACLAAMAIQADTASVQQPATTAETPIEYTDTPADANYAKSRNLDNHDFFLPDLKLNHETAITVIAIVAVFGLPVFIVFIAYFFKYKNRKAKYRLAEQALAAGQPIPEEFFRVKAENGSFQKGITNVFTGIGLFIFLWAITDEFSIGCIGLLIMFMGFGQVVIHYANNKKEDKKSPAGKENNSITGE